MLQAIGLSKEYGNDRRRVLAVRDVSLEVRKGEFLAITGRSGSGKSTLLGLLGGLCRPTSGSVTFQGTELGRLDDIALTELRREHIGLVFQFGSLLPTLRAIDNVALPALLGSGLRGEAAQERAKQLLTRVGLGDRLESYPGELSGGEQRRVAIARALVNRPRLLLADEPTGDLDEETEAEIIDLLTEIQREDELTLVVVTHNPAVAARADRVARMRSGSISEESSPVALSVPRLPLSVTQPSSLQPEPAATPSQLGEGLVRFLGSCAAWGSLVLVLLLAVNQGLAFYQQQRIDGRAAAHAALEELAMSGLRADIADITPEGEEEFLLKLYLWNVTDGKPLFVLAPDVRAFVQVGSGWTEVPLESTDGLKGRVLQIDGKQFYTFRFRPDVANFEELLPGYLHVRFTNQMLISPRSEPTDDLVERSDNYYVYLKPRRADDQELLKKLKFPGKPPVWIPMPPH